jgi:hypothetical protein
VANFPGNVLIIDDKFDLIYGERPTGPNRVEYSNFKKIKNYCDDNGLPLLSISDVSNIQVIEEKINKINNVRLLILDLDLDGDGNVTDADEQLVISILDIAIKRFGYFFLLINSITPQNWNGIKQNIPANNIGIISLVNNLEEHIDKTDRIAAKLDSIINRNYSIKLIYSFESKLNNARDKAFKEFIDYDKETWQNWIQSLRGESGSLVHHDISNVFISLIKQYMIDIQFETGAGSSNQLDSAVLKKIYVGANYLKNIDGALNDQPIWTGNLYKTTRKNDFQEYAMVLTPECDIAQRKFDKHKIVFGVEVNSTSLNEYAITDGNAPIIARMFPKNEGKWKKRNSIIESIRLNKFGEHYFQLPFASENEKGILFDYRSIESVAETAIKKSKWILCSRINDPLMTEIMDKYSNLYNRKGLITYPYAEMKLYDP